MNGGSLTQFGSPVRLRELRGFLGRGQKMQYLSSKFSQKWARGQALIEYLLMTMMLLFLFIGLYRTLQTSLKELFTQAGIRILTAYY